MGGPGGFPRGERSSGLSQLLGGASFLSLQAAGTLQRRAGLCRPAPTTRQTSWKEKGRKEKKIKEGRIGKEGKEKKEMKEKEREKKEGKRKGKKRKHTLFLHLTPKFYSQHLSRRSRPGRCPPPPATSARCSRPGSVRGCSRDPPGPPRTPGPPHRAAAALSARRDAQEGVLKAGALSPPFFLIIIIFYPPP